MSGLGEILHPLHRRIDEGGYARPQDVRELPAEKPFSIIEFLPDFHVLHCRDVKTVNPAAGAVQNFTVGDWEVAFDAYAISTRVEIYGPDVANLLYFFIRTGQYIPTISQNSTITNHFDPFWTQVSGTKGSRVRIFDPYQPYGKRVLKGGHVLANLQVVSTGAGNSFDIEIDVQVKLLDLGSMVMSAP